MKKWNMRFLSLFLCFMMVAGTIGSHPITSTATQVSENSVSENSTTPDDIVTGDDNTTDTDDTTDVTDTADTTDTTEDQLTNEAVAETVTAYFYDSDGATLLLSVPMQYDGSKVYLCDVLSDVNAITLVHKGYQIKRWYRPSADKENKPSYVFNELGFSQDTVFHAVWNTTPYEFDINYQLNGGTFATGSNAPEIPYSFTVKSGNIPLPAPQRKGYKFNGWYTDSAFTKATSSIPSGFYYNSDANGNVPSYTVYAKWTPVNPGKVTSLTVKNSATGKVSGKFSKVSGVDGYELTYATSKSFKKNKNSKDLGKKTSFTFTNMPAGKTFYFKVRSYIIDSTGNKYYGSYSSVKSCKIKKGVKEYKATKNSGKIKKVSISGKDTLYVKATVSKRLKSSDNFYYLVKVDPNTGKILKKLEKSDKTKTVTFRIPLKDEKGNNHVQGKFGIAIKKGSKYMLISPTAYISNPQSAAKYTAAFPKPASKKGRQGCYDTSLGDKNYFTNLFLDEMLGTKSSHDVAYKYNGKTYYFYYPKLGLTPYANADGGTVTVQVMLRYTSASKGLIKKTGKKSGAHYYAFNVESKSSREKLEALFHFLAEQGSQENCHVDNWILGNEVNTYANMTAKWYYAGNISKSAFMKNYASTFRILYYAVKSNNKNGRVYICCDHTWINRENDWGTKYFMDAFNKEIKSQNKNISWNLAYHAYSAVLTNADFWNDGGLAPNSNNADFVSPKNLEILTKYVKKNYGKKVRIILSEQGFSCSGGVGSPYNVGRQSGQNVQAAATAWLYYKAQFNDMIDAVIFSSGDHGGAGFQFDFIGREAESVYKYMDTPKYNTYTKKYLKVIGKSSWSKAVKNFNSKTLQKMPNR